MLSEGHLSGIIAGGRVVTAHLRAQSGRLPAMKRFRWLGAVVVSAGTLCCSAFADKDEPRSDEEIRADIAAEIDRLNSCDVVADCVGVPTGTCASAFVRKGSDTSKLEALVRELTGDDPIGCPAACQCGILTCEASKCTTAAGNCMEPSDDEQMQICL